MKWLLINCLLLLVLLTFSAEGFLKRLFKNPLLFTCRKTVALIFVVFAKYGIE